MKTLKLTVIVMALTAASVSAGPIPMKWPFHFGHHDKAAAKQTDTQKDTKATAKTAAKQKAAAASSATNPSSKQR